MIDRAKAYTIARDYLDKEALEGFKQWKLFLLDRGRPDLAETYEFPDLVIDDHATQEKTFGWVFFWNSREYYETDDGSCPLFG